MRSLLGTGLFLGKVILEDVWRRLSGAALMESLSCTVSGWSVDMQCGHLRFAIPPTVTGEDLKKQPLWNMCGGAFFVGRHIRKRPCKSHLHDDKLYAFPLQSFSKFLGCVKTPHTKG